MKLIYPIFLLVIMNINSSLACAGKEKSISNNEFKTHFLEFISYKAKKLVLIIPPTGGINFIDRSYAKEFCKKGISAVIIKNWSKDDELSFDLEIHTRFYTRAQKAIEVAIKYYHDFELGILGTSVGGIHASIATARFKELKSSLIIVSGGGIASIIVNTTQEILVEAKKKRFLKYKYKNEEEYRLALRKVIPFEPLGMSFNKAEKKLGMVISTNDDVVPTKNQLALKELWNPIVVSSSGLGHKLTVVKTWLLNSSEVISFFM